jgi:MYXO-CTERM domain-containing protein
VFVRSIRINSILSIVFITAMGACGNFGGCGACGSTGPLPGGKLPTDQTIEGGAQVRVTPAGFTKMTSILPGIINQQFAGGFCVGQQQFGFSTFGLFTGIQACKGNSGTGCNPGCKLGVSLNPNGLSLGVTSYNSLRVGLSMTASTAITMSGSLAGVGLGSCTLNVSSTNFGGNFDIGLGVKASNGELDLHLIQINSFNLNMDFSGCGVLSDVAQFFTDVIDSFVGQFIIQLLSPLIDDLLQQFLPSPLGIAGMMDIGKLLEGVSPGTEGFMEARIVPGGYADLVNGGMNLGIITGLNSDEDPRPASRTPELDSEPALCVPPIPAPVFTLPTVARSALGGNTHILEPANEFIGAMDPAADIAMGISNTTLDLLGHHLVTSGGMCLGVGTNYIQQLNVGTVGILVPSLAELQSDKGNDPLLLVTRPQKAIDFTIGDHTTTSPDLTMHLRNIEVDFYAFLFERYTRAFTMDLTMNVGININFEQTGTAPAVMKLELVGISSSEVTVKILNSEFVRETAQHLEGVLPSVFDLVTPLLGNLPDIPVPSFAGFTLNNLSIRKVVTSQDKFLALYATLGASQSMRLLGERDKFAADAVAMMDSALPMVQAKSVGKAKLLSVDTPDASIVRDELISKNGALPSVAFEVDRYDAQGRELEWSWNLNGGMWRPYASANPLVISDRAFAWQGRYEIGLKSRVKGDIRTVSDVIREKVVIDSVGPQIFSDKAKWDGTQLEVPVWDVVYGKDVEVAFGEVGSDVPQTKWVPARGASLARASAAMLADGHDGEIAMFARDELGNQTVAIVAPFHGQAGASGCSCESTGRPGSGSLVLFGLVGLGLMRRRRRMEFLWRLRRFATSRTVRSLAIFVGIVAVSSLVPACSCGNNQGKSCETAADCGPDFCGEGEIPFCIDNTCVCSDDIPAGRIGVYSDVGAGGGTIWVSAYASTRGDLVVAQAQGGRIPTESWEWVDGVPDGPVVVPDSKIRNGIDEPGTDVGMYTSIAVTSDGTPMVSYFDRDTASLKFAARVGGVWQIHTVSQGTSQIDPGSGGSLVGMYTSLTLRSDDGRPGIAYLAHVKDANGERAEVRYASSQTQFPTSSADWQTWTVDTGAIPEDPAEIYPLPGGLGLFVDSARNPMNQAPVVVYYDRTNGDLKLSRFNPASGQFATPVVLDGSGAIDAGWSPSVSVDATGTAHVVYVSATGDDLKYTTDAMSAPKETVDDGYRIVGTTVDGLPKPEFHFVGDDATIVLPAGGQPIVTYQDATSHELLLSSRKSDGTWTRESIAGATDPWPGAYGFFASSVIDSGNVIMSSWVIDQPNDDNWVEVFSKPVVIQ